MVKGTEFGQDDLAPLEGLIAKLTAPAGRHERRKRLHRWISAKPASGDPDVSVDLGVEEDVLNLIVTTTGFEPGKALVPILRERGVSAPSGWQLMADVGWVIGWRTPRALPPEQVVRFGLDVVKGLRLEPEDKRWRARFEKRPPRPGWQSKD